MLTDFFSKTLTVDFISLICSVVVDLLMSVKGGNKRMIIHKTHSKTINHTAQKVFKNCGKKKASVFFFNDSFISCAKGFINEQWKEIKYKGKKFGKFRYKIIIQLHRISLYFKKKKSYKTS